jgi:hypothetical protein
LIQADIKVVSKVTFTVATQGTPTTSGSPPSQPVPPQQVTVYYRGGNARTEIQEGSITIFNGKEGKVYLLNPAERTYVVKSVSEFCDPARSRTTSGSVSLKASSDITLSPGVGARTCAGIPTSPYEVSGTVILGAHKSGSGRSLLQGLGGLPGLGSLGALAGIAGGGRHGGESRNSDSGVKPKKFEISGEYWMSESLKLPDERKASPLAAIYSDTQIQNFVFRPLSDSLSKLKSLPLDSRITVASLSDDGVQHTVTRTATVISVSQDPLPDNLFIVPAGYSKIVSP